MSALLLSGKQLLFIVSTVTRNAVMRITTRLTHCRRNAQAHQNSYDR
jgi:hypothetical protein